MTKAHSLLVAAFFLAFHLAAQPTLVRPVINGEDTIWVEDTFSKGGDTTVIQTARGPETYVYMEQLPEPPVDIQRFIVENLRYPLDALAAQAEGRVNVRFVVTETGHLDSTRVLKPVFPSLDKEALRLVKSIPTPWKPAKMYGKIVRCQYTVPVMFRLD